MAFWGIELRPGKPYTLDALGKLRVCQATLGNGKGKRNSVLQCNVGNKSPIFLCTLIPNVSETCHLELEFEEDEEVVFSVLGRQSIYLSGYHPVSDIGAGGDETDSHGEDTGEEDSGSYGSHDSEEVVIREIVEDGDPYNGNANRQCLRKNSHISDTNDGDQSSQRRLVIKSNSSAVLEDEDKDFSLKKKHAAKNAKKNVKSDKRTKDDKKRKIKAIIHTEKNGMSKKKQKVKVKKTLENGSKSSDGKLKKQKKDKAKKRVVSETGTKFSAERTEEGAAGDPSEVTNADGRDQDHPVGPEEPSNDNDPLCRGESSRKQKKKNKKKRVRDDMAQVKAGLQVDTAANSSQQDAKKKKKKKSRNQDKDINANQELSSPVEKENKAEPSKTWTFANGLTIVELAKGKPGGQRASPGCKVYVNYTGKLKNGEIFDSNVGKRPLKFHLGIGQVIKGWDIGVKGMRVGDKRRLIIPPSLGYGEKAVGKIPENSWLLFDVELVDVQ